MIQTAFEGCGDVFEEAERLRRILHSSKIYGADEAAVQERIARCLGTEYVREYRLDKRSRIHVSPEPLIGQLRRSARSPKIRGIALVSYRLPGGFPDILEGKPAWRIDLLESTLRL